MKLFKRERKKENQEGRKERETVVMEEIKIRDCSIIRKG